LPVALVNPSDALYRRWYRLFQHLGSSPSGGTAGDHPQMLSSGSGMFGQGQKVAADQVWYMLCLGQAIVARCVSHVLCQVFGAGALAEQKKAPGGGVKKS